MFLPVQEKFTSYGFVLLAPGQEPSHATTTFPEQWHETYFENEFHRTDPVFSFASKNIRQSNASLLAHSQMTGDLFDAAREYDAASNFVSVSHFGGNTLVFGGVNTDLDDRALARCHELCRATHRIELSKRIESLTDAQIDLLELAEEGCLDKEISQQLQVSMSAIAQRKQAVCAHIGVSAFRAALQLYSLDKWGGMIAG